MNPRFEGWNLTIAPTWDSAFAGEKTITSLAIYDGTAKLKELDTATTTFSDMPEGKKLLLVATYTDHGETVTSKTVIETPKQSEGLIIIDGVITGIGTCTDSKLYLNMPMA